MSTYNGWLIVTMPTTPMPATMEAAYIPIAAANTNPFTGQQQVQSWGTQYQELSVSFPPMAQSDAQAWIAFLKSCNGIANVFLFPSAFAAAFPESLTTDGTSQPYWRLKENQSKWSVRRASIYGLTFEVREAI